MKKRRLWEIISPNPPVRYGLAEKLNVGHWMNVRTPYGERLQVFEHGIGKEGGTSILLRHGYSGSLRSISHDPAEYLVEVSATQRRRRKGVLFAHTYKEAITIDSGGNVKQYSITDDIYPKIGYAGTWYDVRAITNVSPELGIIFLYSYQDDTTYWYIVDKSFNVIKAGTFGNANIEFENYTYYNGKLRVLFYNWDDDTFAWSEWTKDGMLNIAPLELELEPDYVVLSIAGRYAVCGQQGKVYFYDYEDNKLVLSLDVGASGWPYRVSSKAVGYNKFRVYVPVYVHVVMMSYTELFQLLPEDGSSINIDDLLPVSDSKVYEFYVDDREVRLCNEVYGDLNEGIISRDNVSAYSVNYILGSYCLWTNRGSIPPYEADYGAGTGYYWRRRCYDNNTVLTSLDGIDYSSSFVAPPDTVFVHEGSVNEFTIAKGNREVKLYDPDNSVYGAALYSFDVDVGEILIEVMPRSTYEKVYFRITDEKIERISSPSYYKLTQFRGPGAYLAEFINNGAGCGGSYFDIDLGVLICDCREVDPDLFYEAMQEAQYILSFNGGAVGPPYDCICEHAFRWGGLVEVSLQYTHGAYLLYKVRPNEQILLSHAGPIPLRASYMKRAYYDGYQSWGDCYYFEQEFVYNTTEPFRGIDMDYQYSGYGVYIGQYLYHNYLRVCTNPTFIFRKLDENKYLIYGLSDVVLLEGNTFKQLVYGGPDWNSQIIVNKKVAVETDSIDCIIAADEGNVRWFGYLNDVRGEYLNDRLISRDTVEYAGSGHNFVIYRRLTDEGWKYYIADMDTLITGQDGIVLDKPTSKFFDFDAQDVFVFGTRPNIKIKRVE